MYYTEVNSPVGALLLAGDAQALAVLGFSTGPKARAAELGWERDDSMFADVRQQLDEYFAGARQAFDLALAPRGTKFQLAVWQALREIPYGETCSYRDIAVAVGSPKAVRAVGAANGNNPLPVIVPCHRVIGSNGKLTGFGGGLENKRYLLELEQRQGGLL